MNPFVEDNPSHGHASILRYWNKALLYFMSNKLQRWTTTIGGATCGNATNLSLINSLLHTRGIGKEPSADRELTPKESKQSLELIDNCQGSLMHKKRFSTMLRCQVHLIGRNDGIEEKALKTAHSSLSFLSKNVHEEQDCPRQIFMGSMNAKSYIVLGLALFPEKWIASGVGTSSQWLFLDSSTIKRGKKVCSSSVNRHVFKNP